jgi:hypothetical protein
MQEELGLEARGWGGEETRLRFFDSLEFYGISVSRFSVTPSIFSRE